MPEIPILTLIGLAAAVAAFLVPGWLLGRAFGTPLALVTSFLGSSAVVFNAVLLLDVLRIPIGLFSLVCASAASSGLIALVALRRRPASRGPATEGTILPRGFDWLWVLPPAFALVSIVARTVIEPLSGYDNSFRWDYLARFMISRHSLHGYPPVRMADFDAYPWCDGIPPLVPVLNFLIYSACGTEAARMISVRAALEFILLGAVTFAFARKLWSKEAGWPAVAVLSSSALLVWGISIEQETGITAVALVAMLCFLSPGGEDLAEAGPLWAGFAAGVGAISREYGLYFIILGAAILLVTGRRRRIAWFLVPALGTASPWYARNWWLTGDPVFPAMGRLFPTNAVHVEIMRDIADFIAKNMPSQPVAAVLTVVGATAGAAAILGLAGVAAARARALWILSGIILITLLWAWSIPVTAGGWNYSMRVLLPAVALAAVLSGWIGSARGPARVALAVILALLSADAAHRAWTLPDFPLASPWTLSFSEWRQLRAQEEHRPSGNFWPVLIQEAAGQFIVVDSPGLQIFVNASGGHATPFMSPRFAPALDPSLPQAEAFARLRALGVRFVTFSVRNPVVNVFVMRHATLRALAVDYAPVADIRGFLIFDLRYLSKREGKPAAPAESAAPLAR